MYSETWAVKTPNGEEFGCIRTLMIDSHTRQLSYADVALSHTNQIVRLPWVELEVRHEGIFLKSARLAMPTLTTLSPLPSHDVLVVPKRVPGKLGYSRRSLSTIYPR